MVDCPMEIALEGSLGTEAGAETVAETVKPPTPCTYAQAAGSGGVNNATIALKELPNIKLLSLLEEIKDKHNETDCNLANLQTELKNLRSQSSKMSNSKRGPVRLLIAEKKTLEQQFSFKLLHLESQIAQIQTLMQQRLKHTARVKRQESLGGRRDIPEGEGSGMESGGDQTTSPEGRPPPPPNTLEVHAQKGITTTEEKWGNEERGEWRLKVAETKQQQPIKEALLAFDADDLEGAVDSSVKRKKKKSKKNPATHKPEPGIPRESGGSVGKGEYSSDFTYSDEDFPSLRAPGVCPPCPCRSLWAPHRPPW
ncbi:Hypothetical predicted protein [Pelobates cultripes]|uniref:Uncharacterized protein n=1 Tax=Pelobates cultripes TaxID=61616 RepID=A0AAD1R9D6_PELCU|nr:Hypothetical predicted protein [Pelobates cultripes]